MKQKNNRNSIKKRILFITMASLLSMCLLVSLTSYLVFNRYLRKSLISSSSSSLELLADSINAKINSINLLVRFTRSNSAVATYIKESPNPGSVLSVSTFDRVYEEYVNNPASSYIPRYAIITGSNYIQIVNSYYSSDSDLSVLVPQLPYFDDLVESKDYDFSVGFIKDPFFRNGIMVLPIIRPITYEFNAERGGYLFMEINTTLFTDAFKRYGVSDDSNLYLSLVDHHYIYEDGVLNEIEELPSEVVSAPLAFKGITISQSISAKALQDDMLILVALLFVVTLVIIIIGAFMTLVLNRMISAPVAKLQSKISKVSLGDFNRDSSIEWDHELGDVGRGINDLAENVNTLMETRLADEKQKRDLEYKVLQSQINPHFIYNTLNSIKWMATVQGASGISEMTTSLAKLLKSISKGTSSVISIGEELNLLEDYFTIQKYRYGGTVKLKVEIEDEEIKQFGINKFTLQPIVENAIFHGIEPKGNGTIEVSVNYEKDGICITVYDDGIGMSKEKLDALLIEESKQASDFFKEIGVKNVHNRIQYEFGTEYGLSCESIEGEYTAMYIHIPARKV